MAYVDLNFVRAGLVDTSESSEFTSACEQLHGWGWQAENESDDLEYAVLSDFLDQTQAIKNAISFAWKDYLSLLGYSGKVIRADKAGFISQA